VSISFRSKLFVSYAVLATIIAAIFYLYCTHLLEQQLVAENRSMLLSEARLVRVQAESLPTGASLQYLAERLGNATTARISLVALDGQVLADSQVEANQVRNLENHLSRPEIRQALSGDFGSSVRYSETLRTRMLYVAVKFSGPAGAGVVRLALPLSSLEEAKVLLHRGIGIVAGAVLILALLFSAVLSGLISRPLRKIAEAAANFGGNGSTLRIPVSGEDEVAALGRVLNRMAGRIEEQLLGLKEERQRLDTILSSMGEGVVVLDPMGRIILANPAFRSCFDLPAEHAGISLAEVCRNPDLLHLYKSHLESGREITGELVLPAANITFATHWVQLGANEGTVAVFHDITELKRLEGVRREFVANVSHELRTPVTVIKGYAETLLARVEDPATAKQFIATIQSHADRLAVLISDLLALSELEAKGFRLALAPVNLAEAANSVIALLDNKAEIKGITVVNELATGIPLVAADRQRLEQIFFNLLDNALTYTPAGGRITISADVAAEEVIVKVSDTGSGIPPQHLPRLFERFYRVDPSRSREKGGTGLGLAIVKHIVQLHGGTVGVASTPGKGSTFSFTLKKADTPT
jgi:two-component system phosphate regulon sensor histidine kinase PhoR